MVELNERMVCPTREINSRGTRALACKGWPKAVPFKKVLSLVDYL